MSCTETSRSDHDTPDPRAAASPRFVLLVMCVGYFLVLLDVTIVNVALPSIDTGLHAGVAGLQWVVDGYALALACLMLAGGTIGDARGHRRVVLTGLVTFGVASLGCGLAPTIEVLVGARVLQGVGAAAARHAGRGRQRVSPARRAGQGHRYLGRRG
ncbi:MAG: MFS transporter, partial [Actinomycetota bacterium]|nr:MFS transporter [Actinomycetota bacterium]